jgi:hypothetical protein
MNLRCAIHSQIPTQVKENESKESLRSLPKISALQTHILCLLHEILVHTHTKPSFHHEDGKRRESKGGEKREMEVGGCCFGGRD